MARRKDHTREELKQLAIDCGRELVITGGPNALTARNVAAAMGYTPGTLYNIFTNIEGLIVAINISSLEDFADRIHQLLNKHDNARQSIHEIAKYYVQFQDENPNLWSLLFATPVDSEDESYHLAIHKVFDQVTAAIRPISGNEVAARQDAKIIWSTLHGICLLRQNGKLDVTEVDPAEQLIERFLHNFLKL